MQTADHPRRDNDAMTVFLSHSTKDGDFVEKLAIALDSEGFTPWLCETSIEPAANWVEEIEKGLKAAHLVLLVWSPNAAASYATGLEWTSALAREIAEKRLRLGVVKLGDCEPPELLRTRQYIYASKDIHKDSDKASAAVLDWLKGRRDLGRLAGDYASVILEGYPKDDLFVGRVSYLEKLRAVFSDGPARFLLHGEPGAGKSTLALKFAWEAQKDFDAVVFQRCGQRSVGEIVAELAYKLRGQLGERVLQLPPEKKLEAAAEWLRARQSLLVLDDVWTAEVKQIEPGGACSVLHTSRQQSLPWISAGHTSEVVSFSNEECQSLFHASLDKDFGAAEITQHRETLLGFAARVERLPIAVAVGASLLREKSASALGRAVLKLRLDALTNGSKDVNALFGTAIASQPEREQRLLAACAVCVQEGFWLPLAAEIAGLTADDADDAADRLVHSSLLRVLDRERRRFQLHSLLRDQVRTWEGDDGLLELTERHAAALEKLFKDWETRWQGCRECLEEIIPAAEFVWLQGETSREDWLTYWGYAVGKRIGELDAALRILQQEESFWAGSDNREAKNALQRSYGNQANILYDWGRLEEALALHKKEEAICEELGDKDGLQRSYGNQALILIKQNHLNEALILLQKSEAICVELGLRRDLGYGYWQWAGLARAQGDRKTEKEKLEQALAIFTELKMPIERDAAQAELEKVAGG